MTQTATIPAPAASSLSEKLRALTARSHESAETSTAHGAEP